MCRVLPCEAGGRGLDVNPVGLTSTCAYALADPRVGVWGGQFATHAPPFEIARLGVCMRAGLLLVQCVSCCRVRLAGEVSMSIPWA